jgi:hypothetical protein
MIIYSVTVTMDQIIEADWVAWMRTKHIPEVMETGCFAAAHLQRLLDPAPEPGVATYNVQYECPTMEAYEVYREIHAPALQADHSERYKDKFVAFRTILKREDSF